MAGIGSDDVRADGPNRRIDVSVILPAYNEADNVEGVCRQVASVLDREDLSYEILFIDDGSSDGTWDQLRALAARDARVRAVRHRSNYGKACALANGFRYARGEIIVTSDADMQYDPRDIVHLIEKVQDGYDVVSAYKVVRRDRWSRRAASKVFNFFVRNTTHIELHDFNAGLKAYHRDAAAELVSYGYGELHRFFIVLAARKGFSVAEVPVESLPRPNGSSKYGLERYMRGALDFLTALFLANYMERPAHLLGSIGVMLSCVGFLIFGYLGYLAFALDQSIANRPLLTVGVLFILSGIQFIGVGLLAEMMTNLERDSGNISRISQVIGVNRRSSLSPATNVTVERRGAGYDIAYIDPSPEYEPGERTRLLVDSEPLGDG